MQCGVRKRFWSAVILLALAGCLPPLSAKEASYRNLEQRQCPILDTPYRTRWGLDVSHTFGADTGTPGWGDTLSVSDVDWWVRLFSLENNFGSELEAEIRWENRIMEGFANASDLDVVYSLSMVRLFLQWSQRFLNGYGVQLHTAPGVYTGADGFDGDPFSYPTGIKLIKAYSPNFSIFAGATVYPDFDVTVDPTAGFLYAYRDRTLVQLAYPESRLEWSPVGWLRFLAGARMLRWPDYSLGEDDIRERVQYEEIRVFGGLEIGCTERLQLAVQGGYVMERTLSFTTGSEEVELEDAPFAMIGLRGRL